MTETKLDIRRVGYYSPPPTADQDDCTQCGNADWADVLLEGVCGKCLLENAKAAKTLIAEFWALLKTIEWEAIDDGQTWHCPGCGGHRLYVTNPGSRQHKNDCPLAAMMKKLEAP